MIAACALLLGAVHAIRWLFDREARADLTFAIISVCFVGFAYSELHLMNAADAAEWGRLVSLEPPASLWATGRHCRICPPDSRYRPPSGCCGGLSACAASSWSSTLRCTPTSPSTQSSPSSRCASSAIPYRSSTRRSRAVGKFSRTLSTLLLVAYLLDATIAAWRRGTEAARNSAVVVGVSSLLVRSDRRNICSARDLGLLELPFLITPAFILIAAGHVLRAWSGHVARVSAGEATA